MLPSQSTWSDAPHSQLKHLFYEILSSAPEFGPKLFQNVHLWVLEPPAGTSPLDNMNIIDSIFSAVSQEKGTQFSMLAKKAIEVMLSGFLCGYSKEELEACDPENNDLSLPTWVRIAFQKWWARETHQTTQGHLKLNLYILHHSLAMLEDLSSTPQSRSNPQYTYHVNHYLKRSPLLWRRFWDLKETVLNAQKAPCERSGVYTCLNNIAASEISLHLAQR